MTREPTALPRDDAGVALIEVLIMILVMSIMTALAVHAGMARMQKATLARCFAELRSIQSRIEGDSMEGGLPSPEAFWKLYWHGGKPGPYVYLIDDNDPEGGRGGDLDGFDERAPGSATRPRKDVRYVVLCQHDHGDLALYVYLEDDGPPTVADAAHNPHHDMHIPKDGR